MYRTTPFLLALGLLAAACASSRETPPPPPDPPPEAPAVDPAAPPSPAAEIASPALAAREGGALVRAPGGEALYLADEDHAVLRRIPLPLDAGTPPRAFPLPGRPAQALGVGDRVLVTVRDPGMLLVLRDRGGELSEEARVPLPADAWGMAVSADGSRAVVSSAWTHRVSLVDLGEMRARWSVEVAREPRGVALRADGTAAWISHLTGTEVTSIEDLDAAAPRVRRLALPADPLRAPAGEELGASLGYSAVLSADEGRLFVARHALGGIAWDAWFGTSTVDVLATRSGEPVAPRRGAPVLDTLVTDWRRPLKDRAGDFMELPATPFVQPRAMVLRRSTSTLLVAGEGNDALVELDSLSVAPALAPLRLYALAGPERRVAQFDEEGVRWGGTSQGARFPVSACGAPSGIALTADDEVAYVYCRSTDGLAMVPLDRQAVGPAPRPYRREETYVVARVGADPLPEPAATGRRLFFDATDFVLSGGLGCAGCHPEGRDDGFVWREIHPTASGTRPFFVANPRTLAAQAHDNAGMLGLARQTPMLAGRVAAAGPYGWLAESASLVDRIREGFALHRWAPSGSSIYDPTTRRLRAEPIAAFLREGLVAPPARGRPLDVEEERGRDIFLSETAGCAKCHDPATGYTDRLALPLFGRRLMKGFDPDRAPRFKVPSLFYAGATAPYFHDGAAATLEDLVEQNLDHMGMTSHLTAGERHALVAFVKSIEPDPVAPAVARDESVPFTPARPRALPPDQRGPSPALDYPSSNEELPRITAEPWPETRSPAPVKGEWARAKPVRAARSLAGCTVRRVREWVRAACGGNALMMAAGSHEGVTLDANLNRDVESAIVFPVRRGDRRVFQLGSFWKWMTVFGVLSEQWLDGDAEPTITVSALYSPGMQVLP